MAPTRVLLTGANGFIGSHILQVFLDRSIFVQAVVRSEAKANRVRKDFPSFDSSKLDFSIVPDITASGAFDQCLKDAQPLDAIVHTASPFNYSTAKIPTDFINPAVRGTTEIIESAAKYAPGLKRFVITSSFAAIGNPVDLQGNGRVYSSDVWNPLQKEQIPTMDLRLAYWASKTFAEQAAWEFMKTYKPGFEFVVLNPPIVYGPLRHSIDSMSDLNTSNALLWSFMTSKKTNPVPADALHINVDVRDLALAHYHAAFASGVGNRRYLVSPGSNGNQETCDILRKSFPELDEKIPLGHPGQHDLPAGSFKIDNSASREVLGMTYRSFETTVTDTARNLLELEKELSAKA
ncbi:Glycine-rich RNA-binding protein 2, mitochondrial [Cladophialophora chaetospira]|uniref:Glycine-rich RNA-binding protein 2, mitochondrial n=1 Tax=Cladophialophora chaetospira TaxID=386627 RepID=A0AA38WXJ3_9EURO|nr:Glycine-rich RNA-binding protein 2, mitochondrial [Cladophialophora chaetospira]